MDLHLTDKKIIVTGGAEGIGRATVEAFVQEGCLVAAIDHNADALRDFDEVSPSVRAVVGDLSTATGVSSSMAAAVEVLGGVVDVLVNNVGAGAVRTFDEISDPEWQRTLDLNFFSYLRAARYVLPIMRSAGSGVIINNASDLARQPEPNPVDYSVSKAAVLALTKGLARSEGPAVRVNAVAPGPIWTPFWTKPGGFAETLGDIHDLPPLEAVQHEMSLRQLPLQRLGTPSEVASVITFLASDQAAFVTSSVWGVDGGSIRSLI